MKKETLSGLRAAIDALDAEILDLLERRAELAHRIGAHKRTQGAQPFYVPSREAEIIRRLLARHRARGRHAHAPMLDDAAVHAIFREIIGACLALEQPLSVAFLGPEGTFSHEAARRHFGGGARLAACATLDEVFEAVEAERAGYGVVPVENVFEGAVGQTLDLLAAPERRARICAEIVLEVHHQLLSLADDLREIRRVYSHPQALAQCRGWLDAHLPAAARIEETSTAAAAGRAREEGPEAAAIGPRTLADTLGLNVLVPNIEDHRGNRTRFFVIGRHDAAPTGRDRTTFVVSVEDRPGALFHLLRPFAERGVGLTRIESRPSRRRAWEYLFFIDAEGHREREPLAGALAEAGRLDGADLRVLGSYPQGEAL